MSPLVQRPRAAVCRPDPIEQHWSMLLFESLSAGVMAIFVGFVLVLAVVGVYVIIVWPLTFWDLANVALDQYQSWAETVLWSVFAGGSLAGYWCFSGHAFKSKSKSRAPIRSAHSRR
jgi:hypothetical protein